MPHYYIMDKSNHLAHYGHKGQKWGVRNYQNYDGTYTQAGLERYWPGSKHGTRGGNTPSDARTRGGINPVNAQFWFGLPGQVTAYAVNARDRKRSMKLIDEAASHGDTSGIETLVKQMLRDSDVGPIQKRDEWSSAAAKKVAESVSVLRPDGVTGDELKDCFDGAFNGRSVKDPSVWKDIASTHGVRAHAATIQSLYDDAMNAEAHRFEGYPFKLTNAFDANKAWQVYGAALIARTGTTTLASDYMDQRGVEGANMPYSKAIMGALTMANMMDYADRHGLKLTDKVKTYNAYDNAVKFGIASYPVKEGKNAVRSSEKNFRSQPDDPELDSIIDSVPYVRGGKTRGGMMTDMTEGISEGVVRLGERATDALRRTGERMVDKASAKDEEKRVKRELASLTRAEYGDPIETKPDAWTRIRSTDLNRQSVVQQLRQDIANGMSTADARKKYFDPMVKATLADRNLVGNKDAERQLREAWSSRTSPYGYSGLSSAARVREERKLDKQRDELQKMRSKVYDENYNIVDPALYKKYKAAKEQYKADKKSINDRVSRDVYSDYNASKR